MASKSTTFTTTIDTSSGKPTITTQLVTDVIVVGYNIPDTARSAHIVYDVAKLQQPYSNIYQCIKNNLREECWSEVVYGGVWADKDECARRQQQLEVATLGRFTGLYDLPVGQRVIGFHEYTGMEHHTSKPWVLKLHITQGDLVVTTNSYLLQQHPGVEPVYKGTKLVSQELLQRFMKAQSGSSEFEAIWGDIRTVTALVSARQDFLHSCKLPNTHNPEDYYVAMERSYFRV